MSGIGIARDSVPASALPAKTFWEALLRRTDGIRDGINEKLFRIPSSGKGRYFRYH